MGITSRRKTETTFTMSIERDEVIEALRSLYPGIPLDAEVWVDVPGGGDWSNTDLSLGTAPLRVSWTTREES